MRIPRTKAGIGPWPADAAAYYENHKDYLANLLLHTTGYDSFVRYMTEINHDSLRDKILLSSGEEELEEITEMYLRAYCLGTVSLTCEWIPGKYAVSSGELKEVYEASLPEPLHKYFF